MHGIYAIATQDGHTLRAGLTLDEARRVARALATERGEALEVYPADGTDRDVEDNDSIVIEPSAPATTHYRDETTGELHQIDGSVQVVCAGRKAPQECDGGPDLDDAYEATDLVAGEWYWIYDDATEEWWVSQAVRPVGRPQTGAEPIDRTLSLKTTATQRAKLERAASARGVTIGEVVRDAIDAIEG